MTDDEIVERLTRIVETVSLSDEEADCVVAAACAIQAKRARKEKAVALLRDLKVAVHDL